MLAHGKYANSDTCALLITHIRTAGKPTGYDSVSSNDAAV
jgi:hypothetical protein